MKCWGFQCGFFCLADFKTLHHIKLLHLTGLRSNCKIGKSNPSRAPVCQWQVLVIKSSNVHHFVRQMSGEKMVGSKAFDSAWSPRILFQQTRESKREIKFKHDIMFSCDSLSAERLSLLKAETFETIGSFNGIQKLILTWLFGPHSKIGTKNLSFLVWYFGFRSIWSYWKVPKHAFSSMLK